MMKILGLFLLLLSIGVVISAEDIPSAWDIGGASDQDILAFAKSIFSVPEQSVAIEGNRLIIRDEGAYVSGSRLSNAGQLCGHVDNAGKILDKYPGRFEVVEIRLFTPSGEQIGILVPFHAESTLFSANKESCSPRMIGFKESGNHSLKGH